MSRTHENVAVDSPVASLRDLIDVQLHMPFPLQRNPHEREAASAVDAWLNRWGLSREPGVATMIARTRPAELASFTSPTVDRGLLEIVALQIAYQFIFDDRAEEVGHTGASGLIPMLCESVAVLSDGRSPGTPLGAALSDLHRQVSERCTPAQAERWAWRSREYVHGLLYEAVAQADARALRTADCTSVRSLTAGVEPFHPLYEAAQPCEVNPAELHHPVIRRLGRLAADIAVWTADLFSAVKEQRAGEVINLALARRREHRCSLQQAVTLAIRDINSAIRETQTLHARVEAEFSPTTVGYVEGMIGWIPGCYHWSRTVPRYADVASLPALAPQLLPRTIDHRTSRHHSDPCTQGMSPVSPSVENSP